jgi:hypothetical protein
MDALLNKIEIFFWDRVTPALSESRFFQTVLKKGYEIIHQPEIESTLLLVVSAAVFGLFTGLILSILSAAS